MTVIASVQASDGIFTISDVMVSSPRGAVKRNIDYPLYRQDFFRLAFKTNFDNSDWVPSGTAQKAVLFDTGCLALWAGSPQWAKMAIKDIAMTYGHGRIAPLSESFDRSGLEEHHSKDLSLIIFRDNGVQLRQDTHNLDGTFRRGPVEVLYCGSGAFHSMLDLEDITFRDGRFTLERMFLDRAAIAMMGDVLHQNNSQFLFGGWFEFTRCENPNFVKIPYAIKLWGVDGERLFDGPAYVSGYNKEDLLIFYRDPRSAWSQPPTFIPDFLGRSGRQAWDGCAPERPHEIEFHFVHFYDLNRSYYFLLVESQNAIKLEVDGSHLHWSFRSDVVYRFINRVRLKENVGYIISRPSDVV